MTTKNDLMLNGLKLTKRPSVLAETQAYTGEGLPPVGTVCEIKHEREWRRCEIIAHKTFDDGSKTHAIAWIDGDTLDQSQGLRFRPIRTAEQIAAEERKTAIDEMNACSPLIDKTWSRKVCEAVYDAGYRKQEQK